MARKFRVGGIELDYDEVIAELESNPVVTAGLLSLAKEVQDYWKSIAPVDDGDYKDSISTRIMRGRNGVPFARVEATDYKAHWIEYGTGEPYPTPEFAPMRKTKAKFQL